jgi:hypothetical protein
VNDVVCPAYDAATVLAPPPADLSATPSAGAVPGAFSVSAAGQATYRVPLVVPPGRLGMEPRLAVTYDSSSREGPLGVGFSLEGLSAITRCPANVAQDGHLAPVRYDDEDHYCLDGLRLVPRVSLPKTEFRTFPDTFSKIVAHYADGIDGPSSFTVYTKAGHVLEYGSGPNSRAMATGPVVAAWWLSSESDRRGNAVVYTYTNTTDPGDGHTRQILPARIDYTRHPSTPASRAVVFEYTRSTPSYLYTGGLELERSARLTEIRMEVGPSAQVVRSYGFVYEVGVNTRRQLLRSLTECAGRVGAGHCKPATTFTWSSVAQRGLTKVVTPPLIAGDKRDDFLARWVMADVNGDGLDDIVMIDNTDDRTDMWRVALNQGGSFANAEVWITLPHPKSAGSTHEKWTLTPIDVDQDGRTDIFIDSPNPTAAAMPRYRWLRSVPNGRAGAWHGSPRRPRRRGRGGEGGGARRTGRGVQHRGRVDAHVLRVRGDGRRLRAGAQRLRDQGAGHHPGAGQTEA